MLPNDPGQKIRGFRQRVEGVLVAEQVEKISPIGFRIDHVSLEVFGR
jgi:hypothetical protein